METITGKKITVTCGSCCNAFKADIDPQNIGAKRQLFCYEGPPTVFIGQTSQGTGAISVNPPVTKDRPACGKYSGTRDSIDAFKKAI